MAAPLNFRDAIGFEWDAGNLTKNWESHGVTNQESEEVFSNRPFFILDDEKHSVAERREMIFGRTNKGRFLSITFTMRSGLIRVISARDLSRPERKYFDEHVKRIT
jgi:uncharacterized DUF497 family protein